MRYLIDFKNTASQEQINAYLSDNECTLLRKFTGFEQVYLITSDRELPTTEIIDKIINDNLTQVRPHEIYVNTGKTNYDNSTPMSVDSIANWWMTYSIEGADFTQSSINVPKRGKNVNLYLVDSGIEITHPEFEFSNITLLHSFNDDFKDYNGHGTALASVICGKTCGLADPNLKIVKIFQNDVPMYQSDILIALEMILLDMQANPTMYSIVNMSWSIDKNEYIDSKIATLKAAGAHCVVAAGNSGKPIADVTPASIEECYVVGAYNQDFKPCDFSNYTALDLVTSPDQTNYGKLDIWAPGENIMAATLDGTTRMVAGTSIAAAIHSAALAYNFSYLVADPNTSVFPTTLNAIQWAQRFTSDKRGLIDLSDPKYAGSVNYLTTYYVDGTEDPMWVRPTRKMTVLVNSEYRFLLGAAWVYDSCEVVSGTMPPNADIKNMVFSWKPADVLQDNEYKIYSVSIKLNKGTEYDLTSLEFLVLPESKLESWREPTGDPIIDSFTLQVVGCQNGTEPFATQPCGMIYCTLEQINFCRCCEEFKGLCYLCVCENQACP